VTRPRDDDQGRAAPQDSLQLRSCGGPVAARGAAAPAAHCRTPIESYSLNVKPAKHFLNWQQDPYGNWVARLVFPDKARELEITVDLVADMTVINPFDFFVDPRRREFPFVYSNENFRELAPYLEIIPETPAPQGLGAQGAHALPRHNDQHDRPADRRQPHGARGRELPRAHGAGNPDARRDARSAPRARAATAPG
jgi:transglutaminase-like putative cysteine protease